MLPEFGTLALCAAQMECMAVAFLTTAPVCSVTVCLLHVLSHPVMCGSSLMEVPADHSH